MTEHPAGLPFSTSTYTNRKCRCEGCRAARAAYMRERRKNGARDMFHKQAILAANKAAGAWVRDQHPELWRVLYDEALTEVALARRRRREGAR